MDLFRALTRGASIPKNKGSNVNSKSVEEDEAEKQRLLEEEVEQGVDFFHKTTPKRGRSKSKEETSKVSADDSIPPPIIATAEDAEKLRALNGTKVSGEDIPLPIGSFQDLIGRFDFDRQLLENLRVGGFKEPTAIQSEAIPAAMYGKDIIGCAPTGSGKTLAFLIPLVQSLLRGRNGGSGKKDKKDKKGKKGQKNDGVRGLVVSPTKELAYQIFNELNQLVKGIPALKVAYLNKSIAGKMRNHVISSGKFDIIVTTPLRLIDMVQAEAIDLSTVEQLVLDEADRMFESNFVEQTDRILTACSNAKLRRSIFSATITSSVETIAEGLMTYPERIIIGHKEAANSSIEQKLVYCGDEHGKLLAIRDLVQQGEFKPPVIIFLQSIPRAKALFHELLYDGLNVDVIHSERTQTQREETLERFKRGEVWCLICTDVLARGIDFKGINLVINYDVPNSAQAYVHRVGRTGRAGRAGKAVTFYTKQDADTIGTVVNVMKESGAVEGVPEWMRDGLAKVSRNRRKDLKRKAVEREEISTVPKVMREKRRKKRAMVEGSKRRKEKE